MLAPALVHIHNPLSLGGWGCWGVREIRESGSAAWLLLYHAISADSHHILLSTCYLGAVDGDQEAERLDGHYPQPAEQV